MKQLLFLLLFPCLAMAQYPANGNQKISLGEQTTADGLVFRGLAADTTRKPSVDTMAYILLDTNTNIIWQYKKATSNAWTRVGGSISSGITGTLPVANGGTGSATQNFVDLTTTQISIAGAKTFTSAVTATRFNPTANTETGNGMFLPAANTLGFSTNGVEKVRIKSDGNVGYGTTNPVSLLHIEKAGGITFGNGDQFRVSSGVSGNRAEFHFTDNITSDAFLSFLPSATAASRYLEISANGAAGGIAVDGNGRLGIGTTSPSAILDVVGANTTDKLTLSTYTTGATGSNIRLKHARGTVALPTTIVNGDDLGQFIFQGYDGTNFLNGAQIKSGVDAAVSNGVMPGFISFLTNQGYERMLIASGGNVTINNLAGTGSRAVLADANGVLSAPVSSITTKENVQTLNYGLNEILQINPVSFDYINKDKWGDERNLGFIIEDMFNVVPEVTGTMNNGDMYLDMTKLIPILTKAIQEQNALIKALEQRILILENK